TFLSFGAQFDMFLSYPYAVGGGFRTRFYSITQEFSSNYNPTNQDRYARSSMAANSFGLFGSGFYHMSLDKDMGLKFGGGLDVDMSTVRFTAGEFQGSLTSDP